MGEARAAAAVEEEDEKGVEEVEEEGPLESMGGCQASPTPTPLPSSSRALGMEGLGFLKAESQVLDRCCHLLTLPCQKVAVGKAARAFPFARGSRES